MCRPALGTVPNAYLAFPSPFVECINEHINNPLWLIAALMEVRKGCYRSIMEGPSAPWRVKEGSVRRSSTSELGRWPRGRTRILYWAHKRSQVHRHVTSIVAQGACLRPCPAAILKFFIMEHGDLSFHFALGLPLRYLIVQIRLACPKAAGTREHRDKSSSEDQKVAPVWPCSSKPDT